MRSNRAELDGRRAGSFGDLSVLGFYPNKQITTGEGGAVLANQPEHAAVLRSLRNQGRRQKPEQDSGPSAPNWLDHLEIGFNFRFSQLACALGRTHLTCIDEILAMRRVAAERYHQLLEGIAGLERPPQSIPNGVVRWFVYVVRLPVGIDPEKVRSSLARRGIASVRYFAPIHLQAAWRSHPGRTDLSLPVTESLGQRTLALPFFTRISVVQQMEVAQALQLSLIGSWSALRANSRIFLWHCTIFHHKTHDSFFSRSPKPALAHLCV